MLRLERSRVDLGEEARAKTKGRLDGADQAEPKSARLARSN
jgi:hypothetical protein